MAIAIVNTTNNTAANAGTTGITINKPASLADGHVMYAFISRTDFADTSVWTCSGWTEIPPGSGAKGSTTGNDRQLTILRKVVTNAAGEPSTYTFVNTSGTSYQIAGIIMALSGVNTTTPEDDTMVAYGFNTNAPNPATLNDTSVTANAFVIAVLQEALLTAAGVTPVAPSTYTLVPNGNVNSSTGSLDNQLILAYKTLGAAGSTTGTNAWQNTGTTSTVETLTAVLLVRAANQVEATITQSWGGWTATATAGVTHEATITQSWGGWTATASATVTPAAFWEPFTQANGDASGWTYTSATHPQVISNKLSTNNFTTYEGLYKPLGFLLPGDFEIVFRGNAPLITGNGGVHVGVMKTSGGAPTGDGYSLFISNAYHAHHWIAGVQGYFMNWSRPGEGTSGMLEDDVRLTYTAATDTWRLYANGVQQGNDVVDSTWDPSTWTEIAVFISMGCAYSPTNETTVDSIMISQGIGNAYPPGANTVQATFTQSWGGWTATVAATPQTPVQATALGSWGGWTATANADVSTPQVGGVVAPLGLSGTIVQASWRIPDATWGELEDQRRLSLAVLTTLAPIGSAQALDGKASAAGSAKTSTINLAIPETGTSPASGSAKTATVNLAIPLTGKAAASGSAKAATVDTFLGITGTAAAASSAKTDGILAIRGLTAKGQNAASAKADPTVLIPITGKASASGSAKADTRIAWALTGNAPAASSAKATASIELAGKAAAASSAKADARAAWALTGSAPAANAVATAALLAQRGIDGKGANAGSAKADAQALWALTGRAGSAASTKGDLSVTGQVDLAGKAQSAASAKADARVAWSLAGKAPAANAVVDIALAVERGLTAKAPNANALVDAGLRVLRGITAKSDSASSAKATPSVLRGVDAKSQNSGSAKADARVAWALTGKGGSAASVTGTLDVNQGVSLTGKAAASGSAKATNVQLAMSVTAKASATASATANTVQVALRLTGKAPAASSGKATAAADISGKAATAGSAKALISVLTPFQTGHAGAAGSAKATLLVARGLDGKAGSAGSAKADARVLWTLTATAPNASGATAASVGLAFFITGKAANANSAEGILIVVFAATFPITMGIRDSGHSASIYDHGHRLNVREPAPINVWETA